MTSAHRTSLRSLVVALCLSGVAVASEPWSDEAADASRNPTDVGRRVTLASALADDADTVEEAVAILAAATTDKQHGADARARLVVVLATQPPRAGWRDLYALALDSTSDTDLRTSLKLRKALAEVVVPRTQRQGLQAVAALLVEAPGRADVAIGAAHAALLVGDVAGADRVLHGSVLTRAEARELVLLLSLSAAAPRDAASWRSRLSDAELRAPDAPDAATLRDAFVAASRAPMAHLIVPSGPLDQAAAAVVDGGRASRARVLLAYGYQTLAVAVLREPRPAGAPDGEAIDASTLLGTTLLAAGDTKGAVSAYDAALALAPGDGDLRIARAAALLADGRYTDARAAVGAADPALTARIDQREALTAALRDRDAKNDVPALTAAWRAGDREAPVPASYGLAALSSGQVEAAFAALSAASRRDPTDTGIAQAAVAAAAQTGHATDAISLAHAARAWAGSRKALDDLTGSLSYAWLARAEEWKAAGAHGDALDAYRLSHALNPNDAGTLRALGGSEWSGGRLDDAWVAYRRAFELDPADAGGLDALVKLADATKRDKEVRALLSAHADDRAVRTAMRNFEIRAEIGAAAAALADGDVAGASDRYQRLLAKDPSNPSVLRGLGDVEEANGNLAGAVSWYRKAHEIDPSEPWGRLGLVNLLLRSGDLDAAETTLQPLVGTTDPRLRAEVDGTRARVLLARGQQAHDEGRDLDALGLFREAMEIHDDTWVLASIAQLYGSHQQYALARAFYEDAEAADPANVYAKLGRIRLYVDRGYHDEAEAMLGELDASQEPVAEVWRYLELARAREEANLARNVGHESEAERILAQLTKKYPDDAAIHDAWVAERLNGSDPQKILDEARTLLVSDPTDERALGAAFSAAHRLGKTEAILPLLDTALAKATAAKDVVKVSRLTRMREQAQFCVSIERGLALHERKRHDEAVDLLVLVESRSGDDVERWDLMGGAWLAVDEVDRAINAYEAALRIEPSDNVAHIGRAGAYASSRRVNQAVDLLAAEWERSRDPDIGLALVEMYQARNDHREASDLLDAILDGTYDAPEDPLPELSPPSGRLPEPFPPARRAVSLTPEQEEKHRELRDRSPKGFVPGVSVGGGIYARPGYQGEQFLTAVFVPARVYELRAGPVAFDAEVTAVLLDDAVDRRQGAQMSAGITAKAGPVDMQFRGGVSPLGFASRPYFIWFGEVGVRPNDLISLGVRTVREPVIDSLTSWAGKEDAGGDFGRVSRISFGGWFGVTPTDDDKVGVFGRGGLHTGLRLDSTSPFWEVGASGGHWFRGDVYGIWLGGTVFGTSYRDQLDKFTVGQGGFFSPELFVAGTVRVDVDVHTKNDKFHACAGGAVGPQYIAAEALDVNPANYIRPGTSLGYQLHASIDWQLAKYWWIGGDYQRLVTGNTWQQNLGMLHVHFGPANAWSRRSSTTFSPLAPIPVREVQACGLP